MTPHSHLQRSRSGDAALRLPGEVTETALVLADGLAFDEWAAAGHTLGRVARASAWWIGDWLNYGEKSYGDTYTKAADITQLDEDTLKKYKWVANCIERFLRRNLLSWSHHEIVAALDRSEQEYWLERAADERWSVSELRKRVRHRSVASPPLPSGKFRCIVLDPPWPIEKIERNVRHKQGPAIDYPVMSLDEIAALPISEKAADGCHIYLWVTHKFLRAGLDLFETWGVSYECAMTWVKNVGMTPFSWMYDTEHVLFGRVGSLELLKKGQRLSIIAAATGHSVKPDEFYRRVVAASPEPRLEMFARVERDGFAVWGNEVTKAA